MVTQTVTLQPMEVHSGADNHLAAHGGPHTTRAAKVNPPQILSPRDQGESLEQERCIRDARQSEVPEDWRNANVTPFLKKGKKEGPGSYKLVSLTSVLGEVMEQLILETTSRHMNDNKMIGSSQNGFTKENSCLTNLMIFYDEMTALVDEQRAVAIIYLNFSKVFDTDSCKILTEKLMKYGQDEQAVGWIENWPKAWPRFHTTFSRRPIISGVPQGSILGPTQFNVSINDLDVGAECAVRKFDDDTKVGGVADIPEGHAAVQRDLERVEKLTDRKLIKGNFKRMYKVLCLGRNNSMH
ncbi:hypothetical protein QYF61_020029 [Mycteria americana]|uniref:Reverse transcriptase domain-containing protein n=1 Tax=Mycteria americana TaxID=33587 RepID=A0AAN7NUH3_MYCAM|nr:hypothetical protein QYF61_020029 [Mycteria americana]